MRSVKAAVAAAAVLALTSCSTVQAWRPTDQGQGAPAVALRASVPATAPARTPAPSRPDLVVVVAVDQFSANLFNQHRADFTGGLKRLASESLVYAHGFQTHGLTETCPGHSTMLTGRHPAETGIPANDWVDPATGAEVYCLASRVNTLAHGRNTDNGPVGTEQLMATTLGDWLKAESPESRVFAVSGKDRGAINLAGHDGDGAFWFTDGFGLTTYVEPGQTAEARLAPVADFNTAYRARESELEAALWTGAYPDCADLGGDWTINGRTFHSALPPSGAVFDYSPALDEQTVDAALYLLETQSLGRRGVADVLGVSLSGTDRIGHRYGTQGPEMCEQLHRLDAALGRLLDALPENTLLVLTADHGGSDFVERLAARGYPHARRADPARLEAINSELQARFGLEQPPLRSGGSGLIVAGDGDRALPEPLRTQVAEAAIPLLRANPDIAFAETRERLLTDPLPESARPELLTVRERMRLSAVAGRSPDIIIALQPNVNTGGRVGGTISGHGTPWDFDREVPILFWRPGGTGQERFLSIRTIDIAPTLANILGVAAPQVSGRCIDLGLFASPACPRP